MPLLALPLDSTNNNIKANPPKTKQKTAFENAPGLLSDIVITSYFSLQTL